MDTDIKKTTNTSYPVSILVPVYNVSRYIERCAVSLFEQTFERIEFVFVDDCSPDDSIAILNEVAERYPERKPHIKLIRHSSNRGIGASRNTLLENASGDYLMWVDSDDFIEKNAVAFMLEHAQKNVADLLTSESYYIYYSNTQKNKYSQKSSACPFEYLADLSKRSSRAALWGTLSKRELWSVHAIRIPEGINYGEDYFCTVCLFVLAGKIHIVDFPFYFYSRENTASYTTGRKTENHFKSISLLFDNLEDFFVKRGEVEKYNRFLSTARVLELGSLLLHTSRYLRKKYARKLTLLDLEKASEDSVFSSWQSFMLRQIVSGHFFFSDILLFSAKVLRRVMGINF